MKQKIYLINMSRIDELLAQSAAINAEYTNLMFQKQRAENMLEYLKKKIIDNNNQNEIVKKEMIVEYQKNHKK